MDPLSTRIAADVTNKAHAVPTVVTEDEITVDESRWQTSHLASTAKTYLVPVVYEDCGPFDYPGVYGTVLLLDKTAVLDGTIIPRYASNVFLPRGIPLSAKRTEYWGSQFWCYDNDLRVVHGRIVTGLRVDLSKAFYTGVNLFLTCTDLHDELRDDLFLYRTQCEIYYVSNVDRMSSAMIEDWLEKLIVWNEAMIFTKSCIKA